MKDRPWGILLVDKPTGITSHDVVDIVRSRIGTKKVGHGGTLDPLATGLLIILIGKSTKLFPKLSFLDKQYEATLRLGVSTSSGDTQGKVIKESEWQNISLETIKDSFKKFQGQILQVPPQVCALRYKGRRVYQLARKGKVVTLPPRKITIYSLRIQNIDLPGIDFYIHCSKGTYIRKLAQDIGEVLGCGACITRIRRTHIGRFSLKDAVDISHIHESAIIQQIPCI